MNRHVRLVIFVLGGTGLLVLLGFALARMPAFGAAGHPYRDAAVRAALARHTPNAVSSVNFDQRGLDTFGEEAILLASVLGAATLLRPADNERFDLDERTSRDAGRMLQATRLSGYLLLPITLVVGVDVLVHGHLTPGGGFQGGVVLATGMHLLYVAGSYPALRRLRPLAWYEFGEAAGMGAVVALGVAGLLAGTGFLANILPVGPSGQLVSSGTVVLFSVAIGVEVASGVIVLLAQFLNQYLTTGRPR